MKVTHLTSVHPRYDTRIFIKMCRSLAKEGHAVSLVVADGGGDAIIDGVQVFDVGASKGRLDRVRNAPRRVFTQAVALNANLYHLHDPELIPIGLKLKQMGKRVVFDSHEDVPRQILSKSYLPRQTRWAISQALRTYEAWACKRFDGVITATPFIRDKFLSINANTIDINNFPLLDELEGPTSWALKQSAVCYVGGISRIRGILELIDAMGRLKSPARLQLAGELNDGELQRTLRTMRGWQRVDALGFVDRKGVREVLSRSVAGLVTL